MVHAFEEIREFFYYCTASALPLQLSAVLPADFLEGGPCHPDLLQRRFVILHLEHNLLPSTEVSSLSLHPSQVQHVVFFKLEKSPFLKQLLNLVVFLSLVYLLALCSFCSCFVQVEAKLGRCQLLKNAQLWLLGWYWGKTVADQR